ncbi:MAG TPA: TRL-like family protein [Planctomycetota bacterium]|nr:TRL-like family protein [Planctomycetota bacterium]
MRKTVRSVLVLAAALLPACVATPVGPGLIYTGVKAPLEATASDAPFSKSGRAKASQVLGLFAFGDASIQAAVAAGGIKVIHHVDYESFTVLGVYSSFEVTVYGD